MILIENATIINEGQSFIGSVLLEKDIISEIYRGKVPSEISVKSTKIDAKGLWLIPGVIDDQVHFREPGPTHKGDIESESRAAIAGGVTSFMEMPNTHPQTVSIEALENKCKVASQRSFANYSFYLGATNDNINELKKANPKKICGIKIFMGSSTGNMLVDNKRTLEVIFSEINIPVAVHCEKEEIIRKNIEKYKALYGEYIPISCHPLIRSVEACYQSSFEAIELAHRYGTRLHVLHISTEKELSLFENKPLSEKKVTAEVCVHHLWFTDEDYEKLGSKIKWNPAVKTIQDRNSLIKAVADNKLDVIATDHAPHLLSEKEGGCLQAASGGPLIQHSLLMMLELVKQGKITREEVITKMCHAPAQLYQIKKRGYIRKGYYADLVLINPDKPYTLTKGNILYKCNWSPLENTTFSSTIEKTFLNGELAYSDGEVKKVRGKALDFDR
ncbi:dihydroorotase [Apibacter mensalis]|uniref:Dihydroorotase n=1 Tax=Apibacter mensalis TaxID=1586267 RepID=A0A0X3AMF0_9FLAO|nr:dihydroorotase [Apibacter mensalis]CVK15307.1 dihydroorotase [Apibacter mensalis]